MLGKCYLQYQTIPICLGVFRIISLERRKVSYRNDENKKLKSFYVKHIKSHIFDCFVFDLLQIFIKDAGCLLLQIFEEFLEYCLTLCFNNKLLSNCRYVIVLSKVSKLLFFALYIFHNSKNLNLRYGFIKILKIVCFIKNAGIQQNSLF